MSQHDTLTQASRKDAVFQAAIDFISTLTGMTPPPIEVAPPEVFRPFREFTDKVCTIFDAQPAQAAQGAGEVAAAVREALEFYADGGHEVELHGKIPWVAERDRLHDRGFHPVCEAYNGSETFVEGGQKAQAALALLDTQPAAGADVPDMVEIMALADSYRNATCPEATANAREWLRAAIAASGRQE